MSFDGIDEGQRVRVTIEGVVSHRLWYNKEGTNIMIKGPWGCLNVTDDTSEVVVEKIGPERPTWWDKVRPGAMVQTSNSVNRRAIKRCFDGMFPPSDAKTHPWMWDNGRLATEDEILEWGPVVLMIQGRD